MLMLTSKLLFISEDQSVALRKVNFIQNTRVLSIRKRSSDSQYQVTSTR